MTEFRQGHAEAMPPVVKNIIIINVLMVVLQYVLGLRGIDLADYLGLHYWKSPLFRPWQLVTHIFMHGKFDDVEGTLIHIGFNMFALWMFGRVLENLWGPKRFLLFYFVCGIGAAICYLAVLGFEYGAFEKALLIYQQNPTIDQYALFIRQHGLGLELNNSLSIWSSDPNNSNYAQQSIGLLHNHYMEMVNGGMVGASGAVFGVLFAFGYLFPNIPLYIFFVPVPIKAKYVVGAYALYELFSGIQNTPGDNVAHFAHIGGMIFAFILLRIWNKKNRQHFY